MNSCYVEEADWHQGCMAARPGLPVRISQQTHVRVSFSLPPFFSFSRLGYEVIPAPVVAEL
jgi:hypothetical protein